MTGNILLDSLRTEECDRAVLLIRHGEKVQPPEDEPFRDVALTENGEHSSLIFGKELGSFVGIQDWAVLSSPLKRCLQTAESIIQGLKSEDNSIEISPLLGNPGPYVEDSDLAGKIFLEKRNADIIKMQLERHPLMGFRDIEEGTKSLLKYLFARCERKDCIAITHDVIIAALIGCLSGEVVDENKWIRYLDGVLFCMKDRKIYMYTKEIYKLDIVDWLLWR